MISENHCNQIASELSLTLGQINRTVELLQQGATVPLLPGTVRR